MKALITGITGQDGTYLSEFLLNKGYSVFGLKRRSSGDNTLRLHKYLGSRFCEINLLDGDMTDFGSVLGVIARVKPDEIYNLAAQSFVGCSFTQPEFTNNCNASGIVRILEAVRSIGLKKTRIYQASSSEMFGKVQSVPQNEKTPFYPRSPYGISKVAAYWSAINYRETYGIYVSNGILFNHESPLRGDEFVTTKIVKGLWDILRGSLDCLYLGNLNAKRDWGHAKDYVRAMWMILQHDKADDFVIAAGKQRSVREFVNSVSGRVGLNIKWKGEGISESGFIGGRQVIKIFHELYRPLEVDSLLGDSSKAWRLLGWKPEISFDDLISDMVSHI